MSIQGIPNPKLIKIVNLYLTLENVTGLLISAGKSSTRIGGIDVEPMSTQKVYKCGNEEIKVPVPYIPGSSIKGRMRSLLELSLGLQLFSSDTKIWSHTPSTSVYKGLNAKITIQEFIEDVKNHALDKLFGFSSFNVRDLIKDLGAEIKNKEEAENKVIDFVKTITPTLLLVEDFFPSNDFVCKIYTQNRLVTFNDFLEDKNENRIDRITAAADPRTISRVAPHTPFEGKLSLLVFNNISQSLSTYLDLIIKGLQLLEDTYLGASGSRGYGRVKFTKIDVRVYDVNKGEETEIKKFNSVDDFKKGLNDVVNSISEKK